MRKSNLEKERLKRNQRGMKTKTSTLCLPLEDPRGGVGLPRNGIYSYQSCANTWWPVTCASENPQGGRGPRTPARAATDGRQSRAAVNFVGAGGKQVDLILAP